MNKITPEDIRQKVAEAGLNYEQVYTTLGMSRSWFYKMIMNNPRYEFKDPKPAWMELIMNYLNSFILFKGKWQGKAK